MRADVREELSRLINKAIEMKLYGFAVDLATALNYVEAFYDEEEANG